MSKDKKIKIFKDSERDLSDSYLGQFESKQHARASALYSIAVCKSVQGKFNDSQKLHLQVVQLLNTCNRYVTALKSFIFSTSHKYVYLVSEEE